MISKDLIKIFNNNEKWKNTDINISEATNIAIAIASLKIVKENFIADVGDIIKANLKEANEVELVNLAKATFYMRDFKHTKDVYSHLHAECVARY